MGIVNYYYQQLLSKGPPPTLPVVPLKRLSGIFTNHKTNTPHFLFLLHSQQVRATGWPTHHCCTPPTPQEKPPVCPEDALPESLQYVRGPIYSQDTPIDICCAIAGHHQAIQHDIRESSMADVCGFFMEMAEQKHKATGIPYLQDEEVYYCLVTYGLVRGSEKSL